MRWSHWVGIAKEFEPIISCYGAICGFGDINSFKSAETRALIVETSGLLQKCKSVARTLKIGRPSRCLSSLNFDLTPPSRQVADKMAALYFQSFESTHRILHEPTFWRVYERFWSSPETASGILRLQVLLVIAIGSSLAPHVESDSGLRQMVHQWIYAAETWLSGPLEKDRLNISGLQIHCLVMLARQVFSIGGEFIWVSSGSLIHRAIQIGLHRDPKHLPPMSVLQAQLRRRLWATILELVVQSSLDSALPSRISFDEFDTEPPANSNDNEIGESATELKPHPKETFTGTSMQIILLDSLPTRLRILSLLNGLNSELSYLDVLDLSADILQTCPSPEPDEGFFNLMAIGGGLFKEGIRYATSIISLELLAQVETQYLDGALHRNSHYINPLKKAIAEMTSQSIERIRQGETNVKSHMFLCMITAQAEATEEGVSGEGRVAKGARDSISLCLELLQDRLGTTSLSIPTPDVESIIGERDDYTYGLDFDMDFFLAETGFS
ncbi:fungal specific transcription factor domain-containing protein [Trichoderma breve]|uniref:Fungal specific transcription factor domain-containing protein n=1 Tax=Trichoderma breve TaxID=2034170 RepID=A0A9W9E1N7_9HYPO|nr:fungal specific transcription factor domain-containing protein [Trichoderma breve]KAJ4854748.1 fungal specific transcription factor domain-containing protein [Trichoderma breve]